MSVTDTLRIRCVINLGNPLLACMQGPEPQGISVDIACAWAQQRKQTCTFTVVKNAREAVELLEKQKVDLGFLAIDPNRAQQLPFANACLQHAQLIRAASSDTVVETFLSEQADVAAGVNTR
jgi:polar amino acid transport system substrate-binding protein